MGFLHRAEGSAVDGEEPSAGMEHEERRVSEAERRLEFREGGGVIDRGSGFRVWGLGFRI